MHEQPRAARRRWLQWILAALALLLLVRVLWGADSAAVFHLLISIGPALVLALIPYLAVVGFEVAGWKLILDILAASTSFGHLLVARLAAEAANRILPGGAVVGETLKPAILRRNAAVGISESTASLVIVKILTVGTHGVYLASALALGYGDFAAISNRLLHTPFLPWVVLAVAGTLLLVAWMMGALVLHWTVAARLHRLLAKVPGRRFRAWLASKESGFLATDQHVADLLRAGKKPLILSAGYFFASWIAGSLESFVMLRLLGIPLSPIRTLALESAVSVLTSLGFFVPGSLGVQDLGYMAFLRAFGIPDPANFGAAFVLLKRLKELSWVAIGLVLNFAIGEHQPT